MNESRFSNFLSKNWTRCLNKLFQKCCGSRHFILVAEDDFSWFNENVRIAGTVNGFAETPKGADEMGLISLASNASAWRGYEYYEEKKVIFCKKISDEEYFGEVKGNSADRYHVTINVAHPRKSSCNCPHADGRRIICKHKVALYFSAFPDEAEEYIDEIEAYEREEEERRATRLMDLVKYVKSLSKKELQEALISALIELEENDPNSCHW